MRPTAGLLAASALVTLSAPATGGTAAPARACYREGARTLRSNAEVRVYRRDFDRVYGCAFATGKRRLLGSSYTPPASSSGGGGITGLRLAGHYVAVVQVLEDQAGRLAGVTVTNLRSARTVYNWDVGAGKDGVADDADITDVVLRPNSAVAFIEGVDGPGHHQPPKRLIVRRHDSRANAILEDSATVDASSLRLRGDRITWRSGGALRTATLQ